MWQQIDTAPKDKVILVGRVDDDGSYWVSVAEWYVGAWAFPYSNQPNMVLLAFEPTIWQPLPKE